MASVTDQQKTIVFLTDGMAGDAERFEETVVWHNETVSSGEIVLCGFYGDALTARTITTMPGIIHFLFIGSG